MGTYLSLSVKGRGWGGGGRLFEAGRLLTFSAFRMGVYLRLAIIQVWALIRINTVSPASLSSPPLSITITFVVVTMFFTIIIILLLIIIIIIVHHDNIFFITILSLMTCCCCFSLDALDPDAYEAFQASNNLSDVVQRCLQKKHIKSGVLPGMSKKLSIRASLMTPVKPMLVCINGVNQDLLWRSKKTCDNCGETVPSYIVTYMYDSAPNDKFVLTPPSNVTSNIELISTHFDDNSSLFG